MKHIITLIAITWSIFISTSYENICEGVYINRLDNKYFEEVGTAKGKSLN